MYDTTLYIVFINFIFISTLYKAYGNFLLALPSIEPMLSFYLALLSCLMSALALGTFTFCVIFAYGVKKRKRSVLCMLMSRSFDRKPRFWSQGYPSLHKSKTCKENQKAIFNSLCNKYSQ